MNINLTGAEAGMLGDFRDDLARDGYAVVKGALSRETAEAVAEKVYQYLEGLHVPCIPISLAFIDDS